MEIERPHPPPQKKKNKRNLIIDAIVTIFWLLK